MQKNVRDGLNDGTVNTEDYSKCAQFMDPRLDKKDNEGIRNRFVTGNLAKAALRNELPKATTEEEDDDVYGDFEDLETGEKIENNQTDDAIHNGNDLEAEERRLKKLALCAKFDSQYPFSLFMYTMEKWDVTLLWYGSLLCDNPNCSLNR